MSLITIDPGNNTGWALFEDSRLIRAGVCPFESFTSVLSGVVLAGDTVLIEMPRHYPRREKGDVNDLLDLAMRVGMLKQWCESRGASVKLVWPRTWKGTVPKDVHNQRVLHALGQFEITLLPLRLRAKTYDHNMLDAVGMGLWELRRLR